MYEVILKEMAHMLLRITEVHPITPKVIIGPNEAM